MLKLVVAQIRLRLVPVSLSLIALTATARATLVSSTWQGGPSGAWSDASHWTPSTAYPQNGTDNYQVSISGAYVTLSENIAVDSVSLNAGNLNGAQTLSTGLTLDGLNSLSDGLTLNLTGPIAFADDDAALTTHGNLVFKVSGAGNYTASNATLTNATGGTLSFDPANGIAIGVEGSSPFHLINEGTIVNDKPLNFGYLDYIHATITNSGLIHVTGGAIISISGDAILGGTLQTDANSGIAFYKSTGDQFLTFVETVITGEGFVAVNQNNTITGSIASGTLIVADTTFTGSFTVGNNAALRWDSSNSFSDDSALLTNHGQVAFGAPLGDVASSASFVNAPDGILSFQSEGGSIGAYYTIGFKLINEGTILADNSTFNSIYAPLTNFGDVVVTPNSTLVLAGAFTQNSGEVHIDNATLTALSGQTLHFNGGSLRGTGQINAPLTLNSTALEINSAETAGNLTITGDLAFETGSSLRIDLNGTTQGTAYDHLTVNGTVALGGDLMVRVGPAFLANIQGTNTFTVLDATGITGSFANAISGQRVNLPSGLGDCVVTVTGTKITLSDFVSSTLNTFLANAGVPADQRDYAADPDHDGHPNLLEYALDLDPLAIDPASSLPVLGTSGNTLTLTYRRMRADVVYEVITTTNLADPGSWTTVGVTQGTPNGTGLTTASIPLAPSGKTFLRLRVNYAP